MDNNKQKNGNKLPRYNSNPFNSVNSENNKNVKWIFDLVYSFISNHYLLILPNNY